jgi:dCTP diphosphatase
MSDAALSDLVDALRRFANERDWDQFHSAKNLAAALSVEAGEVLEHFQWLSEAESDGLSSDKRKQVALELADVFLYLLRLSDRLEIDLVKTAWEKIKINAEKYPAERVRGTHKKYTDL